MDLETCYAVFGGDLEGVRGRLLSDDRITRFAKAFLEDPTYDNLIKTLEEGNMAEAFRAAHTLKGTSRDLGLTPIYGPATELADMLRPDADGNPTGPMDQVPAKLQEVITAYTDTADALAALDA